jgi:hypothetical protein
MVTMQHAIAAICPGPSHRRRSGSLSDKRQNSLTVAIVRLHAPPEKICARFEVTRSRKRLTFRTQ